MVVSGDSCDEMDDFNRRKAFLDEELVNLQTRLELNEVDEENCMKKIRARPNRCACNWQACEDEGPETCVEELKAEIELIETERNAIQHESDSLVRPAE
jgi:hypothetical protein|tara:strand:- start:1499 stop:1795 length:297 start_codon:yes stop_codon:yes gene_type:complete